MTHQEKQKEQSKEWIADDAITVSEISKKADLSRRTFYRAFDCKQDIITYMFERIFPDYISTVNELATKKENI